MTHRLAGGRSRLAVALEDSVQMLVELPPTREPHQSRTLRLEADLDPLAEQAVYGEEAVC